MNSSSWYSSWYLKPDHNVIITLSETRTNLPFKLASQHVRSHQDDGHDFDDLTRSEQLNVLADHRATAVLKELCAAGQPTDFYPLPACRAYLCDATGYITSRENWEDELGRTYKTQQLDRPEL
jgi:hypothetical protein